MYMCREILCMTLICIKMVTNLFNNGKTAGTYSKIIVLQFLNFHSFFLSFCSVPVVCGVFVCMCGLSIVKTIYSLAALL